MSELVLYHGDCIEVLRQLDAECVDAIVTDPPYGLEFMGAKWDSFRVDDAGGNHRHRGEHAGAHGGIDRDGPSVAFQGSVPGTAYGGGKRARTQRCVSCGKRDQFRGRHYPCGDGVWRAELVDPFAAPPTMLAFQSWCRTWAIECLRVLKPGGYMLAFGGTRTYHRLVAGVEDAGFEIRDTIAWLYGQGFPKSLDVAKAIDQRLGAEREVVGQRQVSRDLARDGRTGDEAISPVEVHGTTLDVTAPATPEAAQWQGWGTALKPAHEPIVVARKPLQGSVAANVLEHGTGALNIDAGRIPVEEGDPVLDGVWTSRPSSIREGTTGFVTSNEDGDRRSTAPPDAGRWPANVALDEAAAAMLDAQTGELTSGANPSRRSSDKFRTTYGDFEGSENERPRRGLDRGGASRFFKVVKGDACESASTAASDSSPPSEPVDSARSDAVTSAPPEGPSASAPESSAAGAASTPSRSEPTPPLSPVPDAASPASTDTTPTTASPSSSSGSATPATPSSTAGDDAASAHVLKGTRFLYCPKAATRERNRGLGHLVEQPAQKWNEGGIKARREQTAKPAANVHPTVKPVDLMHWLVRMACPPGGVVLDPFAGSGTTGVACRLEHVRCILIEQDADYLPLIAGRLGVQVMPDGELRLERTRIPEPEVQRTGKRYRCPHCPLAFTDRSLYARHWRAEHDPRRPPSKETTNG